MRIPRWIEQPRTLAVLTLAFALVPAAFAFLSFRSARKRDTLLFDTAVQVLREQFKLSTYRTVSFLSVMRNQWRDVSNPDAPPAWALPPGGWETRQPHLLAVAYASHESSGTERVRWQAGRIPVAQVGSNLADDPALARVLEQARGASSPQPLSALLPGERIAIVLAVPEADNLQAIRGFVVGWVDLRSMCTDAALPLVKDDILHAVPGAGDGSGLEINVDGNVSWTATVRRGGDFGREYGTPTSWVGFAALGLSVVPLSVLVMLAVRAGKLRAALEAEQEIGRLRNHFVSSVSHEFRTPLSVILSGAELLEAHGENLSEGRRAELLAQIKSSTARMNEMVEQVLLLGRIESGSMALKPRAVDVADLCRSIADEAMTATGERCPVKVNVNPAGPLRADETVLRGILGNAVSNAVKYSAPGDSVLLEASVCDGIARFVIRDEGIGIPEGDQARLCDPFYRGSNTSGIPGSGLGLAILKRSVALLGGEFTIQSSPGEGTTVEVTLRGEIAAQTANREKP